MSTEAIDDLARSSPRALSFVYKNWRGETALRRVLPIRIEFGPTDWHPEPQWHLVAHDLEKGAARFFAMKDISFNDADEETQATINEWISATFGEAGSNISVAARANKEMSELLMALAIDDNDPEAVVEAADIVIILFRLAHRFGADLLQEVDRKMAINRSRKWNVAHGHGYHIKENG
ncbi:MazG-like family protein [Rhizobium sp. SU303]|uniref:MazG-like family protein n=1 Tax=Rhizobium sp. SU303 TaxID=3138065 RepID=UPI001E2B35B1|nr:dATP/dGTP pyrophosphohydrolase domain-containing protein [Rhizobium leguminosarum]UFW79981.1 WYL domain-containing protein [Rhizobium leguminosarum bv. viciae]